MQKQYNFQKRLEHLLEQKQRQSYKHSTMGVTEQKFRRLKLLGQKFLGHIFLKNDRK